jgi:hypothetical protein
MHRYQSIVLAHRVYQRAICRFKYVRYVLALSKKEKVEWKDTEMTISQFWGEVDDELSEAMNMYGQIWHDTRDQPLFIDLIIRILIARGYAVNKNHKFLTAGKLLKSARDMLKQISSDPKSRMCIIETSIVKRYWAHPYPKEILKQKYLFHRGLLAVTFGDYPLAKLKFSKCLNTGKKYDPRIRKSCLE